MNPHLYDIDYLSFRRGDEKNAEMKTHLRTRLDGLKEELYRIDMGFVMFRENHPQSLRMIPEGTFGEGTRFP